MTTFCIILGIVIVALVIVVLWSYKDKYIIYCCESQGHQYTYLDFKTLKSLMEVNRNAEKHDWHYDENNFTVYYQKFYDTLCGRKYVIVPRSDWREYKKYIKSLIREEERLKEEREKELQRKVALQLIKAGQEDIDTLKGIINDNFKRVEDTTNTIKERLKEK